MVTYNESENLTKSTIQLLDEFESQTILPSQPYKNPRSNNLLNPITDRNVIISNFANCINAALSDQCHFFGGNTSKFANCINAARILNADKVKIKEWQHILGNLWPIPYQTVPDLGEVLPMPSTKRRWKWIM